jgi:DNA-binding NtrC family response regulator
MAIKRCILIVDDEMGPRESIKMILKPSYDVQTAASGKEALDCLKKKRFDLITLDLRMPGLSGFDVLREIRRKNPDTEVIVITAYASEQNAREINNFDVSEFIAKPFNAPELLNSVVRSLERRRVKNFLAYNNLVVRG